MQKTAKKKNTKTFKIVLKRENIVFNAFKTL